MPPSLPPRAVTPALILATAAAYFVTGRLGLLLAIPPGYATAVWPPSGVALAAALLAGYRVWPGVLLGSFLVNVSTGFDSSTTAALTRSLLLPLAIGGGAALQAVVGTWLIRRALGPSLALDKVGDIVSFIFLGAVVSCCVNASIGSSALLLAGQVAANNYAFTWATWWAGDAIGVLIFTVFLFGFFAAPAAIWRPRRLAVSLPLALLFAGMTFLFVLASGWEVERQRAEFDRRAEALHRNLRLATDRYLEVIRSVANFMAVGGEVSRAEFSAFVSRPMARETGIQALEWVPRVSAEERAGLEAQARAEGLDGFVFSERAGDAIVAAAERSIYYPVYYIEPYADNEQALGFDLGSDPTRREALNAAAVRSELAVTDSLQLVQDQSDQRAVLVAAAVRTAEQREPRGYVVGVLRIADMLESALTPARLEGVSLRLLEYSKRGERALILDTAAGGGAADEQALLREFALPVGDRQWLLQVVAGQGFIAGSRSLLPWGLLLGGLLFNGLLGAFLLMVTGETYRAHSNARALQNTLSQLEATQSQLVEAEKLASLGRMMSGLAHELNTPLGVALTATSTVSNKAQIVQEQLADIAADDKRLQRTVHLIGDGARIMQRNLERAAQLVHSFKEVAVDRASEEIRVIDLKTYIEEILDYLRPMYKHSGHDIELDIAADIKLRTIPGSLSQVITNLLENSLLHGFSPGEKGKIRITAVADNGSATLSYSDSGRGVDPMVRDKIFEPFFTTRRGKGGSGLGLHVVRNIVTAQLGGDISLDGDASGARFVIRLPRDLSA